jgi:hypothetical protein
VQNDMRSIKESAGIRPKIVYSACGDFLESPSPSVLNDETVIFVKGADGRGERGEEEMGTIGAVLSVSVPLKTFALRLA